jgi:hypothetical protein
MHHPPINARWVLDLSCIYNHLIVVQSQIPPLGGSGAEIALLGAKGDGGLLGHLIVPHRTSLLDQPHKVFHGPCWHPMEGSPGVRADGAASDVEGNADGAVSVDVAHTEDHPKPARNGKVVAPKFLGLLLPVICSRPIHQDDSITK